MKTVIATLVVGIMLFTGCTKLKYGNVANKYVEPAYVQTIYITTYIGNTPVMTPITTYYSESYCIDVYGINTKGKPATKTYYIDKSQFDTIKNGQFMCFDGLCDERPHKQQ